VAQKLYIHFEKLNQGTMAPGVHHFLSDPADPLYSPNLQEFGIRFRKFLDDLSHLRYMQNIQFDAHPRTPEFERIAKRVIKDLDESLGNPADSLLGLQNIFGNLQRILHCTRFEDLSVATPFHAIVVSAGPSLENDISLLKDTNIQKRFLIVAVDAVLRRLLEEGITPHIVVATERFDDTLPFFENLPPLNTLLVGQPTVAPKLFDLYTGPIATVSKFTGTFLWLPLERKHRWSGSSVSHLAYSIACRLGASSIALLGQDLAYHPDTLQSHAYLPAYPEWSQPQTKESMSGKTHEVPGNTRAKVPTQTAWEMFANEFELLAHNFRIPTANTSALGMKIPGVDYVPFHSWINQKPSPTNADFTLKYSSSNPLAETETSATKTKLADAIDHFERLHRHLAQLKPSEYSREFSLVNQAPHFMELVLEIVIRNYVEVENLQFSHPSSDELHAAYERFFCHTSRALVQVLECLRKSQTSLSI